MSPIHPTVPAPRSSFVTTLAWLMIVPSALGVLMSTLQSILVFTMLPMDQMVLPPADQMAQMPAFAVFMLKHMRAVMVAFWLLTVLALASGIGLLKRREWARLVVIALLALSIVMNLGGLYVQQSFLSSFPAMSEAPPEFREQFESMASTMWTASLAMALGFSAVSALDDLAAEFGVDQGGVWCHMRLFGQSSRKQVSDPNLGLLTQDRHGWNGSVAGPDGMQSIWLRIDGAGDAPNERIGRAVLACLANYSALTLPLSGALFSLWQPYLDEPLWEDEYPTAPEMLWAQLQLEGVEVQRSGEIVLVYAFKGELWPDAVFFVQVEGTKVRPLHVDD